MMLALKVYLVFSCVGCFLVVLFLKGAGRDFMLDESTGRAAAVFGSELVPADRASCLAGRKL